MMRKKNWFTFGLSLLGGCLSVALAVADEGAMTGGHDGGHGRVGPPYEVIWATNPHATSGTRDAVSIFSNTDPATGMPDDRPTAAPYAGPYWAADDFEVTGGGTTVDHIQWWGTWSDDPGFGGDWGSCHGRDVPYPYPKPNVEEWDIALYNDVEDPALLHHRPDMDAGAIWSHTAPGFAGDPLCEDDEADHAKTPTGVHWQGQRVHSYSYAIPSADAPSLADGTYWLRISAITDAPNPGTWQWLTEGTGAAGHDQGDFSVGISIIDDEFVYQSPAIFEGSWYCDPALGAPCEDASTGPDMAFVLATLPAPTWNGSSGDINDGDNWSSGSLPHDGALSTTDGSIVVYADGPTDLDSLTFDGNGDIVLGGHGPINLGDITVNQGDQQIQAPVNANSDIDADIAAGASLDISGALSLNGNTLSKTGGGTLTISNNNSGGGTISIAQGTIAGNGAVGDLINGGGTISPGASVPEPASFLLMGIGLLLVSILGGLRRSKR